MMDVEQLRTAILTVLDEVNTSDPEGLLSLEDIADRIIEQVEDS